MIFDCEKERAKIESREGIVELGAVLVQMLCGCLILVESDSQIILVPKIGCRSFVAFVGSFLKKLSCERRIFRDSQFLADRLLQDSL